MSAPPGAPPAEHVAGRKSAATERARVRRMRAQLLTVLSCAAGATASYVIACAVIW